MDICDKSSSCPEVAAGIHLTRFAALGKIATLSVVGIGPGIRQASRQRPGCKTIHTYFIDVYALYAPPFQIPYDSVVPKHLVVSVKAARGLSACRTCWEAEHSF